MSTAAGRTVASVATDAGLSVPYVANLENGRGNQPLGAEPAEPDWWRLLDALLLIATHPAT
jgi:hypothetical protein